MHANEQPSPREDLGQVREHVRRAGPSADMTINLTIGTTSGLRLSPGAMEAIGHPDGVTLASRHTPDGVAILVRPAARGTPNAYNVHRDKATARRKDGAPKSGSLGAKAFLREVGLVPPLPRKIQIVGRYDGRQLVFPLPQQQHQQHQQPVMGTEGASVSEDSEEMAPLH